MRVVYKRPDRLPEIRQIEDDRELRLLQEAWSHQSPHADWLRIRVYADPEATTFNLTQPFTSAPVCGPIYVVKLARGTDELETLSEKEACFLCDLFAAYADACNRMQRTFH
jgi:hypothetical protein